MKKEDINLLYIYYRISLDSYAIDIPYQTSSNVDDLKQIIEENTRYRIILVGKVEDIQDLKNHISFRYIERIFTLGDGRILNINNKEITSVTTNEFDLMIEIISLTISYTHDEQIQQEKLGNSSIAKARATDILQLLDRLEKFLF